MSLFFGLSSYANSSYYIQKAVIKGVQAAYNNEVFGIKWDIDLSVLLEVLKKNGGTYNYTMNIRVNFYRDAVGNVTGWGSAFKISRLFEKLNITGKLSREGVIPDSYLKELIGKEICVLFYRSGSRENGSSKFQAWDVVDVDKESLLSEFDFAQLRGYPKNFYPINQDEVDLVEEVKQNNNSISTDLF